MTRTIWALIVVCAVRIAARGSDNLSGDSISVHPSEFSDTTLMVWGVVCLAIAASLTVGLIWNKINLLINTLLVGFGAYVMFGVAVINDTILQQPPDNWRMLADHWCTAAVWLILAASLSFRQGVITRLLTRYEEAYGRRPAIPEPLY